MRHDEDLPTLRVTKKTVNNVPGQTARSSSLIDQMCTATVASMRGTMRGLIGRDTSALLQAARNGLIVEELFFQENQSISEQSTERDLLNLSKALSEIANLAVKARLAENQEMDGILEGLLPYMESILEDVTPSPIRRFMPGKTPPSRRKLPAMKDMVVDAMAQSYDPETIKSGISLFRLIEEIDKIIPIAIKIGASLSL